MERHINPINSMKLTQKCEYSLQIAKEWQTDKSSNLSFRYPFAIRLLSFCDPILLPSVLGFRLCDMRDLSRIYQVLQAVVDVLNIYTH